jgi:hypothetical protein
MSGLRRITELQQNGILSAEEAERAALAVIMSSEFDE